MSYIDLAREEGGRILTGGDAGRRFPGGAEGYFVQPTVIEGLPPQCRVNQEEIFGPVATIIPFDTEAEALAMANGVRLRPGRYRVEFRCETLSPRGTATGNGGGLDELLADPRPANALRRRQGIRHGPRGRPGSPALLHRAEERLHQVRLAFLFLAQTSPAR